MISVPPENDATRLGTGPTPPKTDASKYSPADQTRLFMDALFARDDTVEVRTVHNAGAPSWRRWMLARELGLHLRELTDLNTGGHNIYFGACPRRAHGNPGILAKRCTDALPCGACNRCVAIFRCLFADFDDTTLAEAMHRLDSVSLPRPTLIVISGHGVHVYWLLDDPLTDAIEWRNRQQALSDVLGSDASVNDPARLMRLPGFLNVKRQPYVPCELIECDANRVYDLDEFPVLKREPRKPRPAGTTTERDRKIARDAVGLLKPARADVYRDWLTVGMVLNSVDDGDDMLALWDRWSEQSDKYQPDDCEYRWGTFDPKRANGVTLGTLIAWAREDSGDADFGRLFNDDAAERPRQIRRLDDIGNGQRFVDRHGGEVRYVKKRKAWLHYNGTNWEPDETHQVDALAKGTARSIYDEAARCDDDAARPKIAEHAKASARAARIGAMIEMAKSEAGISIRPDVLDADPMLFNTASGTLDLTTGQLRAHQREDMITRLSRVTFDEGASCPRWLAFLHRVMGGDDEMVGFLRRAVGYSLTGRIGERCLFIPHGPGANGKSVFIDVVSTLLGGYATAVPASSLMASRNSDRPRNDLAMLDGVRLATCVESNEGRRLDEALVKQLTGGDRISARFLFGEFFSFMPQFKIWLATNHRPDIRGADDAIWTRVRLVPFNVVIPEAERDPDLTAKLNREMPGILNWAVQGCLEWQRDGLQPPAPVVQATAEYRSEQDNFSDFLDECCTVADGLSCSASSLFQTYRDWCDRTGCDALNQTTFGRRLNDKGFPKQKCSATRRIVRLGLTLAEEGVPL